MSADSIPEAEARAAAAELTTAKLSAQVRHNIPAEHTDLLTAPTAEGLETQAAALAQLLTASAPPERYVIEAEGGYPKTQRGTGDQLEDDLRKALNLPTRW